MPRPLCAKHTNQSTSTVWRIAERLADNPHQSHAPASEKIVAPQGDRMCNLFGRAAVPPCGAFIAGSHYSNYHLRTCGCAPLVL
jgi:hypothetical protein